MCKVFMLAGITEENNSKAVALVKAMAKPMSFANKDGLGYSALDKEGNMFGERWHLNASAFTPVPVMPDTSHIDSLIAEFGEAVKYDPPRINSSYGEYNKFGDVDLSKMTAITLHTRMATSGKVFSNTHPFVDVEKDTSLIHNGIIRNDSDFKLKLSTCDSEAILIAYLQQEVNLDPLNVQNMADLLTGYYACGVFSRDALGNRVMDIFKANSARLSGAWIKELNTFAYSTSEYDIKEAAKEVGLTVGPIFELNDEWLIRLNYLTGKVEYTVDFTQGSEYYKPAPVTNPLPATTTYKTNKFVNKKKSLSKDMVDFMMLKPETIILSQTAIRELSQAMGG